MESYLDHHAQKLVRRFDAGSYVALTEAMNGHDVGRGRGGPPVRCAGRTCPRWSWASTRTKLYPPSQQGELAALLPGSDARPGSSTPRTAMTVS
ncbi:Homoserine O-acetyltransferase OS=Streptomyces microflavus OX=1919 GN=metXA PE=3 SV=1 [Streptomyces microflavus]